MSARRAAGAAAKRCPGYCLASSAGAGHSGAAAGRPLAARTAGPPAEDCYSGIPSHTEHRNHHVPPSELKKNSAYPHHVSPGARCARTMSGFSSMPSPALSLTRMNPSSIYGRSSTRTWSIQPPSPVIVSSVM